MRTFVRSLLIATCPALFVLLTPATTVASGVAETQFSGLGATKCGTGAGCTINAWAPGGSFGYCVESTAAENGRLLFSGCQVRIIGSFSRVRANGPYECAGIGSGSLHYIDPLGYQWPTIGVQIVVSDGVATISNAGFFDTLIMRADAVLAPACSEGADLVGTLSRVDV